MKKTSQTSVQDKYYQQRYMLAFYEKDDETLAYLFNNVRELCVELGLEVNRRNINNLCVNLYRSLQRDNHQTNLFKGRCMKVYLIDMTDEE